MVLGIWDTVGARCYPIALPTLALCPRKELGTKIRAPRARCIRGGAVNSPAQGVIGALHLGMAPAPSSAPFAVCGGVCVCLALHSPGQGTTASVLPLHGPWDTPSCLGQGLSRVPTSAALGCSKNLGGGSRECWGSGPTDAGFQRCFMCCVGTLTQPRGAGVTVFHGTWVLPPVPISPWCEAGADALPSGRIWGGGGVGP